MNAKVKVVESWAVKYRPRTLSAVVGQADVVARLKGMLKEKRLPGALLFAGPPGTGKTTLARVFARYLNCETWSACGKCESCLIPIEGHPDVFEMNAAEARGIDEVRSLIQHSNFRPRFNVRVIILDELHQLTPQSMQALLKPLEEPPPSTIYALCTTDPQKLPEAVRDRCQWMELNTPTSEEIRNLLLKILEREKIPAPKEAVKYSVLYSGGKPRVAISMLEGAIQALNGNPKIDLDEFMRNTAHATIHTRDKVLHKCLLGLYAKRKDIITRSVYDLWATSKNFASGDAMDCINRMLFMNEYVIKFLAKSDSFLWSTPEVKAFKMLVDAKFKDLTLDRALCVERLLANSRTGLFSFNTVLPRSFLLASLTDFE